MGLSRQAKSKISRQTSVLPPLPFAVGGAIADAPCPENGDGVGRTE